MGDTITYTIVLVATGNTIANNTIVVDSLPSTLTYIPGTFAINGGIVSGGNPVPTGQSIGSLTIPG